MADELNIIFRDFVALMDSGFRCYEEVRTSFFKNLPELGDNTKSLENDLNKYLFNETVCSAIPDHLKTLRRLLIRLEDFPSSSQNSPQDNDDILAIILKPTALKSLAERLESLFQSHWEAHRYQGHHQPIYLLIEAQQISEIWNRYLSAFNTSSALLEAVEGPAYPPNTQKIAIRYYPDQPSSLNAQPLAALLNFLQTCHQFILSAMGAEIVPLIVLRVRANKPFTIELALPQQTVIEYTRFLQHLFLKDMLKQDALLKVVFQSVVKEQQGRLTPPQLKAQEKSILATLKLIPQGKFDINGRKFPQDNIIVLKQLTDFLTEHNISFKNLLTEPRTTRTAKTATIGNANSPSLVKTANNSNNITPTSTISPSHRERINILTTK